MTLHVPTSALVAWGVQDVTLIAQVAMDVQDVATAV